MNESRWRAPTDEKGLELTLIGPPRHPISQALKIKPFSVFTDFYIAETRVVAGRHFDR
jgi:hypothetical protein